MFEKVVEHKARRYAMSFIALVAIALVLTLSPQTTVAGGDKVTICHKPGTPAEGTIEVSSSAVPAHLEHGDTLGACGQVHLECPFRMIIELDDGESVGFSVVYDGKYSLIFKTSAEPFEVQAPEGTVVTQYYYKVLYGDGQGTWTVTNIAPPDGAYTIGAHCE
jgi:hypothetical protein